MEDLTGKTFGLLTVLGYGEPILRKDGRYCTSFKCMCECGNITTVRGSALKSGNTTSCGCRQKEHIKKLNKTHGKSKSRLYRIWCRIKQRCNNLNDSDYPYYGGRGICICYAWSNDFQEFEKWSLMNGYNDALTIDRIDVNDNYCPENCRWVSRKIQANNTRSNRMIAYNNKILTTAEWEIETGISAKKIAYRIDKLGWSVDKALTTK